MGITWTGTQFATAGVSGTIMTSPDGIIWTVRNSGTTADLNAVAWTGAQLLAFGASGTILTSSDGVDDDERDEFGDFLEKEKRCGRGGTKNERGDFTWEELKQKARQFLGYGDDE
jgi:hypothetical protein